MDQLASTLQDFYTIADSLVGMWFAAKQKPYINGILALDDQVAKDMAKPLIQINELLPNLAQQTKKYTAPATLASVFAKDAYQKGMLLRDIIANPEIVSRINADNNQGQSN